MSKGTLNLICPNCLGEVKYQLGSDPDNIQCPHCGVLLALEYEGKLPETQYFLIKKSLEQGKCETCRYFEEPSEEYRKLFEMKPGPQCWYEDRYDYERWGLWDKEWGKSKPCYYWCGS